MTILAEMDRWSAPQAEKHERRGKTASVIGRIAAKPTNIGNLAAAQRHHQVKKAEKAERTHSRYRHPGWPPPDDGLPGELTAAQRQH